MEGVFTWVKNIACFTILTTVIIHILPSNKYEKYLKLYLGLLLILLMISPFAKLFHLDKVMEEFFQKENLKMEMGDIDKVGVSVFESNIDSEKENFIKNELGCFYNLSEDNINVSIQGGETR